MNHFVERVVVSNKRKAFSVMVGCVAALAACVLPASGQTTAAAPVAVTATVDVQSPGAVIPADFLGVSLEIQTLLPNKEGNYYFSSENTALVRMFKALGVKNLRVGGNTADTPSVPIPGPHDIDNLFAFAKDAGVEVIYTLRLRNATDPSADAGVAKYVMDHYATQVECFEIGNEPNIYAKTYPEYKVLLTNFISAIRQPGVASQAVFCGPNTTGGEKPPWPGLVAKDFAAGGAVTLITQHAYFGGNARKVTDPAASRAAMLSEKWEANYQKRWDSFVPAVQAAHLPYRIEETNSFYNGGAKDVSNTHAAALWALDYLYWWATHDAAGVNFHTGDHVAAGDAQTPCWYAAYWTSPEGYHAHPVGYAMKAFDVGSHGAIIPVKISGGSVHMTAYATVGDDKKVYVTLINKENGAQAQDASVTLAVQGYGAAESLPLTAAGDDVASTDTEMLGGARIEDDGKWAGTWTPVNGTVLTLPAASATVIRLSPQ
jgi:hypothetical protein